MKLKALAALAALACTCTPVFAATLQAVYTDPSNTGFNDPSLGVARKAALTAALGIWGNQLRSTQVIKVAASYVSLPCTKGAARLGAGEPISYLNNFTGTPAANRLFPVALAEAISRQNLNSSGNEIVLAINGDIDQGCVGGITGFDYNTNPGTATAANKIRALPVMLHELAHGLGFFSPICLVNIPGGCSNPPVTWSYGGYPAGVLDRWSDFLRDGPNGSFWRDLSNSARITSAKSGNLVWDGPRVNAALPAFNLNAAAMLGNRIRMHAPTVLPAAASVNHFTADAVPNLLMEPDYSSLAAINQLDLAPALLADIGWTLATDPIPTITTITNDSPDPTVTAQAYTVAVTVTALDGMPTGIVNVRDGSESNAATCQITLNAGGTGSCLMNSSLGGNRTLLASYLGAGLFAPSSDTESHTVNLGGSTSTTIVSDAPDPSVVGQAYTVVVEVSSNGGIPPGNVEVRDGNEFNAASCSGQLSSIGGVAQMSCVITSQVTGTRLLRATYQGSGPFLSSLDTELHQVYDDPGTVLNLRPTGLDCAGRSLAPVLWDSSLTPAPTRYFQIEERRGPTPQFFGIPTVPITFDSYYEPEDVPPIAPNPGIFDLFIRVRACTSSVTCSVWSAPLQFYAGGDQCG